LLSKKNEFQTIFGEKDYYNYMLSSKRDV